MRKGNQLHITQYLPAALLWQSCRGFLLYGTHLNSISNEISFILGTLGFIELKLQKSKRRLKIWA